MPGMLAGIEQNPNAQARRPNSLMEGAKYLLSKAWENRGTIMTAAQSLAPLLLAEQRDAEECTVKVNYL